MSSAAPVSNEKFSFTSSIAADVWRPKKSPKAFERWYFDAVSDDGRDAVVIVFLDNFIFSPRYNSFRQNLPDAAGKTAIFPAVAFFYYRDGKPLYRAMNEYNAEDFEAGEKTPSCRIGDSSFRLDSAPYGSGYVLSVSVNLPQHRRLKANFEWLAIEGDFLPERCTFEENSHCWNLVLSRSDVTGSIAVEDKRGKNLDTINFRGTGYHDHNFDNRWLPETVHEWQWGRAHFADSSAVFYRYKEIGQTEAASKLFIICDRELVERDAAYEEQNSARHILGVRYPKRMRFTAAENLRLRVKQIKIIDANFFYLRFLSEMTLTLRDGKPRKTIGITEYLTPSALKYRWLDWFVDMRIGRKGKGAFLK